ncbi:peptidoglycan-binding protein [Luteibacter sp. PPL552]
MNRDIYNEARIHFFESGQQFEYGRPDMTLHPKSGNPTDSSRTEQDNDHDGKRGVDCSSFVWRGLHDAGYDVGSTPFGTRDLFKGNETTAYARQHFDVIPAAEARQPNGHLQPGDIIMFKDKHGSGQHVGIVRDYDEKGHIRFIGSQVSSGPADVTIAPGKYWDGKNMEIVGALRAKPEFQVRAPLHGGHDAKEQPTPSAPHASTPSAHPVKADGGGVLREGAHGAEVKALQERLNALGVTDARGKRLDPDSRFGPHTREAVEAYQRTHGLDIDGQVGPKTLESLHAREKAAARPDATDHASHPMLKSAHDATHRLDAQHGRTPDEQSQRLAGAATVAAMKGGLDRIDHIVVSEDGKKGYAVQGELDSPLKRVAEFDVNKALSTPIEQSSQEAMQAQAARAHAPAQPQPSQPQMHPGMA